MNSRSEGGGAVGYHVFATLEMLISMTKGHARSGWARIGTLVKIKHLLGLWRPDEDDIFVEKPCQWDNMA